MYRSIGGALCSAEVRLLVHGGAVGDAPEPRGLREIPRVAVGVGGGDQGLVGVDAREDGVAAGFVDLAEDAGEEEDRGVAGAVVEGMRVR
jgi:hypothetical protein